GKIKTIQGSGKLKVEDMIQSEKVDLISIIQAKKINVKQLQLKLSGKTVIEQLIVEEAFIDRETITLPLLRKKLICKYIQGGNLKITSTDAEVVEGHTVLVGNSCNVHTLDYDKRYSTS